jgi:hypothetical protein
MLKSLLDGLLAAAGALAFSVLPSFVQQYLAGLATCRSELLRIVTDARVQPGAMSPEFLAHTDARSQWCATAAQAIDQSEGFARIFAFGRHFDPEIARTTLGIFRPAVQLTFDGLYFFLAGVILGLIVSNLLAAPFRFFSNRRHYRFGRMP